MPMVRERHEGHESLLKRNINYVGVEALFSREDAEVADPTWIEAVRKDNILLWGNTIVYNMRDCISAGHNDDIALTRSEDAGWGWMADRGFDLIQTDWPMMLIDYLKRTDRYTKR